ncbi:hypothetical protein [Salinimicrobium sp. HB62]|uniref:hypothetical protein n=1 Tax=Salinimicrobium sp. HB62 TaxID=3077781 RepID=UPI002D78E2C1|nr:hypothetical protein [Salinimicrobium sp. HB62]
MNHNLLPYFWKKIALGIFVLTITIWFINAANPDLIDLNAFKVSWSLKMGLLISLLLFVASKEKTETQRYSRLRLDSLFGAMIAGGIYLIVEFVMEILFQGESAARTGGYKLMMIMLVLYALSFYIKKKKFSRIQN